jgi:hypothetical protein
MLEFNSKVKVAGEVIMEVIPVGDRLIIEAAIPDTDRSGENGFEAK